jgi:hypothetical protein
MKAQLKSLANGVIEVVYHMMNSSKYLEDDWKKLPTLNEYLEANPKCKIPNTEKVRCKKCGCVDIMMQPLKNVGTRKNTHLCMDCKRKLFRSEELA